MRLSTITPENFPSFPDARGLGSGLETLAITAAAQRRVLASAALLFAGVIWLVQAEAALPLLANALRMSANLLGGLDPASLDFFVAAVQRPLV